MLPTINKEFGICCYLADILKNLASLTVVCYNEKKPKRVCMKDDHIEIIFNDVSDITTKSLRGNDSIQDLLKNCSAKLPQQVVKDNIAHVISQAGEIFGLVSEDERYAVDEIEFGISVGSEGKVSLLSVMSGGLNSQATMTIKLKRKS